MKELDELSGIMKSINIGALIKTSASVYGTSRGKYDEQLTALNGKYSNMPGNFNRLIEDYRKNLSDPNTSPEIVEQLTKVLENAVRPLRNSQESLAMISLAYESMKSTMDDVLIQSKQKSSTANPEQTQTTELSAIQQMQKTTDAINKMRTQLPLIKAKEKSTELLAELSEKISDMQRKATPQTEKPLAALQKLCAEDLPKLLPSINKIDNLHGLNEGISEVHALLEQGKMPAAIQQMSKTLIDNIPGVKQARVGVIAPPIVPEQKVTSAPARGTQGAPPIFREHFRTEKAQKFEEIDSRIDTMKRQAKGYGDLEDKIDTASKNAKRSISDPAKVEAILSKIEETCNKNLPSHLQISASVSKK